MITILSMDEPNRKEPFMAEGRLSTGCVNTAENVTEMASFEFIICTQYGEKIGESDIYTAAMELFMSHESEIDFSDGRHMHVEMTETKNTFTDKGSEKILLHNLFHGFIEWCKEQQQVR